MVRNLIGAMDLFLPFLLFWDICLIAEWGRIDTEYNFAVIVGQISLIPVDLRALPCFFRRPGLPDNDVNPALGYPLR